jgi:hypothetical protein
VPPVAYLRVFIVLGLERSPLEVVFFALSHAVRRLSLRRLQCLFAEDYEGLVRSLAVANQQLALVAEHSHLVVCLVHLQLALPLARLRLLGATGKTSIVRVDEVLVAVSADLVLLVGAVTATSEANSGLNVALIVAGKIISTLTDDRFRPNFRLLAKELQVTRQIQIIFLLKLRSEKQIFTTGADHAPSEQ